MFPSLNFQCYSDIRTPSKTHPAFHLIQTTCFFILQGCISFRLSVSHHLHFSLYFKAKTLRRGWLTFLTRHTRLVYYKEIPLSTLFRPQKQKSHATFFLKCCMLPYTYNIGHFIRYLTPILKKKEKTDSRDSLLSTAFWTDATF